MKNLISSMLALESINEQKKEKTEKFLCLAQIGTIPTTQFPSLNPNVRFCLSFRRDAHYTLTPRNVLLSISCALAQLDEKRKKQEIENKRNE